MNHVLNEPLSEIVKRKILHMDHAKRESCPKIWNISLFVTFSGFSIIFYDFRNSNFSLSLLGIQTCRTISNELRSALLQGKCHLLSFYSFLIFYCIVEPLLYSLLLIFYF